MFWHNWIQSSNKRTADGFVSDLLFSTQVILLNCFIKSAICKYTNLPCHYFLFQIQADVAEFFFVDTTPFVDKYFTDPKDDSYDWRGVLPREEYLSNLLKVK